MYGPMLAPRSCAWPLLAHTYLIINSEGFTLICFLSDL